MQEQLFYIATSKIKEVRKGAVLEYHWGNYGSWTNFKSPQAYSKKKVKYDKKAKSTPGNSSKSAKAGGSTVLGTKIPPTAERTINGVSRTCDVRYWQRGYTIINKTETMKKKENKMQKISYTASKPYQYRLQYKDKAVIADTTYSEYRDSMEFIYFAESYKADDGTMVETAGHIPHPTEFKIDYSDCRKNFSSFANNSDSRDNSGTYVLSNVRANIATIELAWEGLEESEGIDLMNTLNTSKDTKGSYPYLTVQYLDSATGKIKNGTFFASSRKTEKYPSGNFKKIEVTLTEV